MSKNFLEIKIPDLISIPVLEETCGNQDSYNEETKTDMKKEKKNLKNREKDFEINVSFEKALDSLEDHEESLLNEKPYNTETTNKTNSLENETKNENNKKKYTKVEYKNIEYKNIDITKIVSLKDYNFDNKKEMDEKPNVLSNVKKSGDNKEYIVKLEIHKNKRKQELIEIVKFNIKPYR
jgi:hypothetical protein